MNHNEPGRCGRLACAVLLGLLVIGVAGCTTMKRVTKLVVHHHLGMARGALDIVSGEAEAREQRIAKLRA